MLIINGLGLGENQRLGRWGGVILWSHSPFPVFPSLTISLFLILLECLKQQSDKKTAEK